jgi:hypothetical protein
MKLFSRTGLPLRAAPPKDFVDVEELLARYSVEDLAVTAEEYFSRLPN